MLKIHLPIRPKPAVSIIVPTYNYGHYIGQAINSLTQQSFQDWECIIVDDGSTDQTMDIVRMLLKGEARLGYYYQENSGLSSARNAGLNLAKGDFIQFLDADDLIEPEKFERQMELLESHSHVDIVYSSVRYFSGELYQNVRLSLGSEDIDWMPKVSGCDDDLLVTLIEGNIMAVSSPLIRRKIISSVGLFDTKLSMFADWDYWLRCAIAGAYFLYDDDDGIRSLVRYHSDSMTHHSPNSAREREVIRKKLSKMNLSPSVKANNNYHLANSLAARGFEEIRAGVLANGISKLCEAAKYDKRYVAKTLFAGIRRRGIRIFLQASSTNQN